MSYHVLVFADDPDGTVSDAVVFPDTNTASDVAYVDSDGAVTDPGEPESRNEAQSMLHNYQWKYGVIYEIKEQPTPVDIAEIMAYNQWDFGRVAAESFDDKNAAIAAAEDFLDTEFANIPSLPTKETEE